MCKLECLRCLKFFGYRYNEIFLGAGPKSKHEIPCIPYTHTLKLTSNDNFNNYLHESFMIWNVPHRATSCLKTAEHFGFWILDLQIRNAQQLFLCSYSSYCCTWEHQAMPTAPRGWRIHPTGELERNQLKTGKGTLGEWRNKHVLGREGGPIFTEAQESKRTRTLRFLRLQSMYTEEES